MSAQSIRTRTIRVLYYGLPLTIAGVGVFRLYEAATLDGAKAESTFAIGILLVACATGLVTVRRSRERSQRDDIIETNIAEINQRITRLEKEHEALRGAVNSRLATKKWLEIFGEADIHSDKGWVHHHQD